MDKERIINKVNSMINKYNLNNEAKELIWDIIYPIIIHDEFQLRLNSDIYPHHDTVSLGEHIISDAIVTFLLVNKAIAKGKNLDLRLAVIIAMFHDLYELPWQNANKKCDIFVNKHGFTHPIEGAINAATWFPTYFENLEQAELIINGVVHHMFPFPVRAIDDDIEKLQLNNTDKFYKLDDSVQTLIVNSSKEGLIKPLHISFQAAKTKEGRYMSEADKIVSINKDLMSFNGLVACVTGKNPNLSNYSRTRKK